MKAVIQWVLRTMMKDQTGVMRTLPKKDLVDLNVAITAERLARNGIDPNALKNANQVENAINQVESAEKANLAENIRSGITSSKSAKVFDLEGKEINPRSKIMGGQQAETETEILARINKENKKSVENIKNKTTEIDEAIDNASPGFAGDRKYDAQLVADDLAEKRFGKEFYDLDQRQQMELYDEAYQGLSKQRFKNKPDPEDMATGGRAGFKIGSIDKARKAFLEFMKKFKIKQSGDSVNEFLSKRQFMKDMVGNTEKARKARQLDEIKEAMKEDMKNAKGYQFPSGKELRTDIEKTIAPILLKDRKLNATGGRIGYKVGSVDKMRRLILKAMGAGTAGIAAAKSGIFSGIGKGVSKQVAEEVVKKSTSTPPAYFFELAEKIKRLGRTIDGPQERVKIHTMPAKDGKSELMLTEDIGTGEMQIKKIGKEGDEMTTEVQTMEYTPGSSQADETTQGIPGDSYEEYTEFNSRIIKDKFNDPDTIEGINVKEIVEEVKDQAPSIKKADGGIARMLGE